MFKIFITEACGLEFRSDRLWESYIKWEAENGSALNVTSIYDRLLATPTLGYTSHFDKFVPKTNALGFTFENAIKIQLDRFRMNTLRICEFRMYMRITFEKKNCYCTNNTLISYYLVTL